MGKKSNAPYYIIGGGLLAAAGAWLGSRQMTATENKAKEAVLTGGVVQVRLTGYWPFTAREDERKMEGGVNDRRGRPLYTLEQHLSDPVKYPYVAVSGDDGIWPYGQRLIIDQWPNAVFRVVDTGSHFRGAGKIYRVTGYEPLDICVNSSKTPVPKLGLAKIVPGDNFDKGRAVAVAKFKDQNVAVTGLIEGRTAEDREALARAIETETAGRTQDEKIAAAWALRNRADHGGMPIAQLLAPKGTYGVPSESAGYASTRLAPTESSRQLADAVLDQPPEADPTDGAVDFWMPENQNKLRAMGDKYREAKKKGDNKTAKKLERFAEYGTEGDVRVEHAKNGLRVTKIVGGIELLGRIS